MKRELFNQIIEERFEKVKNTLIKKGEEYSTDTDVLHNFNRTAQIGNITPERAAWGFMLKHFTSMSDIVDSIDKGIYPKEELLEEKLGDLINYFILLETIIKRDSPTKKTIFKIKVFKIHDDSSHEESHILDKVFLSREAASNFIFKAIDSEFGVSSPYNFISTEILEQ